MSAYSASAPVSASTTAPSATNACKPMRDEERTPHDGVDRGQHVRVARPMLQARARAMRDEPQHHHRPEQPRRRAAVPWRCNSEQTEQDHRA